MYFQVCSNSAYPQHSGERYRTIGPLVSHSSTNIFVDLFVTYLAAVLFLFNSYVKKIKDPHG